MSTLEQGKVGKGVGYLRGRSAIFDRVALEDLTEKIKYGQRLKELREQAMQMSERTGQREQQLQRS